MKLRYFIPLLSYSIILSAASANAQSQRRGHINNIDGEACRFEQTVQNEQYLHKINGLTGNLVFDDPHCMKTEGSARDINMRQIANFITRPYSHRDAAFQTRVSQYRSSSALQERGVCIQSRKYPNIGVVVEFQISNGHITGVKHSTAVQGCTS